MSWAANDGVRFGVVVPQGWRDDLPVSDRRRLRGQRPKALHASIARKKPHTAETHAGHGMPPSVERSVSAQISQRTPLTVMIGDRVLAEAGAFA